MPVTGITVREAWKGEKMTAVRKLAIGAALIGVAALSLGGPPLVSAAPGAPTLPPCTSKVVVGCSPVVTKATPPRGYKIPKKPRGY